MDDSRDESKLATGPRTLEGKRRTKRNAIRHGYFANLVLTGEPFRESAKEYKKLLKDLHDAIPTANALEAAWVEQLALTYLELGRVYQALARVMPLWIDRLEASLKDDHPHIFTEMIDKDTEVVLTAQKLTPDLLLRCKANLERQAERLLNQIERSQRMRTGQPLPPQVDLRIT